MSRFIGTRNDKKGRLAMTTAQLLSNLRGHRIDAI
jgi:hypothetical protein